MSKPIYSQHDLNITRLFLAQETQEFLKHLSDVSFVTTSSRIRPYRSLSFLSPSQRPPLRCSVTAELRLPRLPVTSAGAWRSLQWLVCSARGEMEEEVTMMQACCRGNFAPVISVIHRWPAKVRRAEVKPLAWSGSFRIHIGLRLSDVHLQILN